MHHVVLIVIETVLLVVLVPVVLSALRYERIKEELRKLTYTTAYYEKGLRARIDYYENGLRARVDKVSATLSKHEQDLGSLSASLESVREDFDDRFRQATKAFDPIERKGNNGNRRDNSVHASTGHDLNAVLHDSDDAHHAQRDS